MKNKSNWRFFAHNSGPLVLAANDEEGYWLTEQDTGRSVFTAWDGESLVANKIYREIDAPPDWAHWPV